MTLSLRNAARELKGMVRDFFTTEPTAAKFLYEADAEHPAPGLVWDDTPGKRPVAIDSDNLVLPWARITGIPGQAPQRSIGSPGNRLYQPSGVLIVQLFMRRMMGDVELLELGDLLVAHLRNHTGSITVRNPAFQLVTDREPDSPWRQGNVTAEYDFFQLG